MSTEDTRGTKDTQEAKEAKEAKAGFKVVEGNFTKKKAEDDEPQTLKDVFEEMGLLDAKPELFIMFMEMDGRAYTISNPMLSLSEIVGGMEIHKQQLLFMSAMGEVHEH